MIGQSTEPIIKLSKSNSNQKNGKLNQNVCQVATVQHAPLQEIVFDI